MSQIISLKIIIVGGGIAGLSAAIALRGAGHSVKILERSSLAREVGAAVTIPPNATRVLRAWGLDFQQARMVPVIGQQLMRGDVGPTGEIVYNDYTSIEKTFGSPFVLSHRVDLHEALRILATGQGRGTPAEILTRSAVTTYDPHAGSVTLESDLELTADLIIAADGVHSHANKYILDREVPAVASDTSVIRFILPTRVILEDPVTAHILDRGDGIVSVYNSADRETWLIQYPCRNNELQNFGAFTRNQLANAVEGEWGLKANKENLIQRLEGFHPSLIALCQKTDEVLPLWRCADREALPKLHLSKLVLVGDAAHPMLPHLGQGAATSIEDAGVLGVLCSDIHDKAELPQRLRLFEELRRPRVSAIQTLSKVPIGTTFTEAVRERCQEYFTEGKVPRDMNEARSFAFSYDCMESATRALKDHLRR